MSTIETLPSTLLQAGQARALGGWDIGELLEKEWLLTNGLGGYASSTLAGCNTRRYHGLLVASTRPPVGRVVALSSVLEKVTFEGADYELGTFEFDAEIHPQGYRYLADYRLGPHAHFVYHVGPLVIEKDVHLLRRRNALLIRYGFVNVPSPLRFDVLPFFACRDFHDLQKRDTRIRAWGGGDEITVSRGDGSRVTMRCTGARFIDQPDWWYRFKYRAELARGQDGYEDLFLPGTFRTEVLTPGRLDVVVAVEESLDFDVDQAIERTQAHAAETQGNAGASETVRALRRAADQFVVRRRLADGRQSTTILAGYPWFSDWGRDAMIALPGLLLVTGRHQEAKGVLITFSSALSQGMIPNCFDDYGGEPAYNSVDASLWYIWAADQYVQASGDQQAWHDWLAASCDQIIERYVQGTRFGILMDKDGLITAGDAQTPLTWMDAKRDGVAFTPRHGKAVDVNALWYHALKVMSERSLDAGRRQGYAKLANRVKRSFSKQFWNESAGCCFDHVVGDDRDAAIRPNQLLVAALANSPLPKAKQKRVLDVVRSKLLTPMGLRSLAPGAPGYCGRYEGDPFARDRAYHQGTVWPFLIGFYVEAMLRLAGRRKKTTISEAEQLLAPLADHLQNTGCLGSVSEIFDGDAPQRPRGCFAQAWSVSELLRAWAMLDAARASGAGSTAAKRGTNGAV